MMELKILSTLFETAKATDGEAFDLRFEEAVSLIEQDQFEEAIPIIEQVLKEGYFDIRLIMHLFYAFFLKDGIKSFTDSFPLLTTLINEQWENLSPIKTRESHASKSIVWFFSTVGKRMKRSIDVHHEKRIDSLWDRSIELSLETLEKIEIQTRELMEFFTNTWKLPSCHQHIQYLLKWLGEVKGTLNPQAPSSLQPEKKKQVEEKTTPSPSDSPKKQEADPLPASHTFDSLKMTQLIEKLNLFESLINEKKFRKASLVGSNIQQMIENFDPTLFFPKLFSNYLALTAKHIDPLLHEWDKKGSPHWDALEKLYRTDLEAFVKW